jgi:oligopeptide transport system permease protein
MTIATAFAVLTLLFFLVRMAPGSPFSTERNLGPVAEARLRAHYGLDQPATQQYIRFLASLAGFRISDRTWRPWPDFGQSIHFKNRSVNSLIVQALPVSLVLGASAYLLAILAGVSTGSALANDRHRWKGGFVSAFTQAGLFVPAMVLGPVLVLIFALEAGWFPPARLEWAWYSGHWKIPTVRSAALPVITLAAYHFAYITRLFRGQLRETMQKDFIWAARARGLSPSRVFRRHALAEALVPVLSYSGPALASLVSGTIVVEQMFAIPGLGNYFMQAAANRDYFLLLGLSAFAVMALLLANLLTDIAHALLDPRIRDA